MATRKYKNPTWANEEKTTIRCEIVEVTDEGSTLVFGAYVNNDSGDNPDWAALMKEHTLEDIDNATTEQVRIKNEKEAKARKDGEERRQKEEAFRKQEALFAVKLEAFEIPEVKASTDRALKARIRKSKTMIEVQAYTTILLMKELEAANAQTEVTEEEVPPTE